MKFSIKKIIFIILIIILLLLPVKQTCGAPGYSCAYQGEGSEICYSYDLQPYIISILERILGKNLPLRYGFGDRCY